MPPRASQGPALFKILFSTHLHHFRLKGSIDTVSKEVDPPFFPDPSFLVLFSPFSLSSCFFAPTTPLLIVYAVLFFTRFAEVSSTDLLFPTGLLTVFPFNQNPKVSPPFSSCFDLFLPLLSEVSPLSPRVRYKIVHLLVPYLAFNLLCIPINGKTHLNPIVFSIEFPKFCFPLPPHWMLRSSLCRLFVHAPLCAGSRIFYTRFKI